MSSRELVDHIRSGPAKLVLTAPLRFRRRTRSNPCDFNEFLQALQSSETIRSVRCEAHALLSISEDQWVLLVRTHGRIKDIQHLQLYYTHGFRYFHPFQAVADAVNNAHSLCSLIIESDTNTLPRDPSGLAALANALREHIFLQEFIWFDYSDLAPRDATPDPVLRVLPACLRLREVRIVTRCASTDAVKNLLQLQPATDLHLSLEKEHWLAVTDEIKRGRCNIKA
jgi:hypothetical protein